MQIRANIGHICRSCARHTLLSMHSPCLRQQLPPRLAMRMTELNFCAPQIDVADDYTLERLAPQHVELVPKDKDFSLQRRLRLE
jgi:hypothetical protein